MHEREHTRSKVFQLRCNNLKKSAKANSVTAFYTIEHAAKIFQLIQSAGLGRGWAYRNP